MILKRLFNAVIGFLQFSNVHGFCYVADREIHWIGRLFWLTCIILCYIASYFLILSGYDNYENNSISFVSDTAYLRWKTKFPAIIVCEFENDLAEDYAEELWGNDGSIYAPDIFNEIGFFRGTAPLVKDQCTADNDLNRAVCNTNYTLISEKLRRNCTSLFKKCSWNDTPFECCQYFKPLETELGLCYAANSMQTGKDYTDIGFTTNRTEPTPGRMMYQFTSSIELYILSREEVPSLQLPDYEFKIEPGYKRQYLISITEIDNEPAVKNIAIKHRKCRYPDENYLTIQKYYSFMGCIIEERKKQHYKFCNCTHQLMPNPVIWKRRPSYLSSEGNEYKFKKICNLTGLQCISNHVDDFTSIKPNWSVKKGLAVSCLQSCTEDEVHVIHLKKKEFSAGAITKIIPLENIQVYFVRDTLIFLYCFIGLYDFFCKYRKKNGYGEVVVKMREWPTERFKRTVIRSKLDLIGNIDVSIGGTVGLFIGASVLSIVEIFYYFGFRIWSNKSTQGEEISVQQVKSTNDVKTKSPDVIRVGHKLAINKDNEIILIKSKDTNKKITTPTYTFSYYE